jgi:uncharacterized membrane protein
MYLSWHQYLMALVYIVAGSNHFINPKIYIEIITPYFPTPKFLNSVAGFAEIALGILLCFQSLSEYAAWGIIMLLIAVFPANIYMFQNENARFGIPKWILFLRLPFQFLLIYWAFLYAKF